ncbi:MAG: DeoR/GlpR family DNA-binding transcription regulator [Cellulosilyticaceae bacterium]
MLKIDRQAMIEKELSKKGSILISNISKLFDCSEETIRRDLREMETQGKLTRIHGGAYLCEKYDKGAPIELRESFYQQEKENMARLALNHIHENAILMLDSSSTCLKLAKLLLISNLNLTIITNSLRICDLCNESLTNINLICVGGKLNLRNSSFVGYHATDNLRTYFADMCFISCPTVDINYGLGDNNVNEAKIRELMLHNSKKHFLIADHTKFSKTSDVLFSDINQLDAIITDAKLSADWETTCAQKGIEVNCCLEN